jgi:hypothetical protein
MLLLLAAAAPHVHADDLSGLSVGERDRRLFRLRESAFGSSLASLSTCPRCSVVLEFDVTTRDVCPDEPFTAPPVLQLQIEGHDVQFRLPTAGDLAAVESCHDREEAERALLARCVIAIRGDGRDVPPSELSRAAALAIGRQMSEADPQSDLRLKLSCPECGLEWNAPFDIGAFFWTEIEAWAVRVLRAVHELASAYGWREDDILSMSPWRRQLYLEMAGR